MNKIVLLLLFILCISGSYSQDTSSYKQDTLRLTLSKAEDIFLNKNLDLIAQEYSIDSAKATVITAKLYDNPDFSFSNALYNSQTQHFFDTEESVQVSQLIRLAGKRNKAIALAESGINITQFQFYDLLRTLRFVLRNDFYNIYFLEQSSKLYQVEISSLQKIVPAFEDQVKKGFMAPIDALRIKTQLYTLQAEYNNLRANIENVQSELKLLIRANPSSFIVAEARVSDLKADIVAQSNYQSLVDSAITNRPDLKALNANIVFSNYNLQLQKAFAKPDLTVGISYDRLGSYVRDYNAIGIAFPLPFFNRNQGNIRNAKIQTEVNKVQYESGLDKVKIDVTTSYITALRAEKLLLGFDPTFEDKMKNLIDQVTTNFQKKNITLLEFLDFYDSYKQNVLQMNQLRFNKMSALEQLNFSIGRIIFNQ
jgi:cobalt-zinc-cadmium efflux system outer membrane protein